MTKNVKKEKNKFLKYIPSLIFMGALLVLTIIAIFRLYDMNAVMEVVRTIQYRYIFIGMSLIFIFILFEGLAVRNILMAMGEKTGVIANFGYAAIDYYFCAITPSATGGQPMAAYYMAKDGISVTKTGISLLLNTSLYKIVLLLLSVVAFVQDLITGNNFISSTPLVLVLFILGFLFNLGFVVFLFFCIFKRNWVEFAGTKIINLLAKIKLLRKSKEEILAKFSNKMDQYEVEGQLLFKEKRKVFVAFIYNLIQRVSLFSMSFFVFLAFKYVYPDLLPQTYIELMSVQVIIALAVDSLPFPGGIGLSEALYVFLFGITYVSTNLLYDMESIIGSAMLFTRAISFYAPVLVCFIIVIIKSIINMFKSNKKSKLK